MTPTRVPAIPAEILDYLEKVYPDQVPDLKDTDREVWAKVGEQRVIRKLRHEFNRQTANVLEKS